MITADLRSLTSGAASFSEELDDAQTSAVPFVSGGAGIEGWRATPHAYRRQSASPVPTIDAPPAESGAHTRGPKWRLGELKASVRRLSEMVPNELERIRRRRVQWLGDL